MECLWGHLLYHTTGALQKFQAFYCNPRTHVTVLEWSQNLCISDSSRVRVHSFFMTIFIHNTLSYFLI